MRAVRIFGGMAATAIAVIGSLGAAPSAHAYDWGIDISGTWRVFSDGEWARTNQVKFKQASVLETWTVSVSCATRLECSGEVTSDLGWTGTARLDDFWYIEHDVPNWKPCPDGTFATGHQKFQIWGRPRYRRTGRQEHPDLRRPQHHVDRQRRVRHQQPDGHRAAGTHGENLLTIR